MAEKKSRNRIVVDYQGEEALYLLAIRNRFTGEFLPFFPEVWHIGNKYGFPTPKVYTFNNMTEILEQTGKLGPNEEGYVVEFSDGQRFKIKGDRYLELHRLISGLSFKHTLQAIQNDGLASIMAQIPDEFLKQFQGWVEEIACVTDVIEERVQSAFYHSPKSTRKDFALWVKKEHLDLAPYLFACFDGKFSRKMVYDMAFRDRKEERAMREIL